MAETMFAPDYIAPPGDTLQEALEERSWTQAELARRMGRPKKTINGIIHGSIQITPETALELERALDIAASFWLNLENNYREALARIADDQHLRVHIDWLKRFPIKEMIKRGWLEKAPDALQQLRVLLRFFGVATPQQWDVLYQNEFVAYRKARTLPSNTDALAVWLRQGEREAQQITCKEYDPKQFRQVLHDLRTMTNETPDVFRQEIVQRCAEAGVAVVFVPEIGPTRICGAACWLSPTKALILLSMRYKTSDSLWFTFYHEAGHILLHPRREVLIDFDGDLADEVMEQEADTFAKNQLVSPADWRRFVVPRGPFSRERIVTFAHDIGVAPGIIVGRLQHEKKIKPFNHRDLKVYLSWSETADDESSS